MVSDLNRLYRGERALWSQDTLPQGFGWIDANDASGNVFSFLRWGDDGSVLACVVNFSATPHEHYRLGLPRQGRWEEVLNTDAEIYGGSGVGNLGAVTAEGGSWHGQPTSAIVRVPPLGAIWLRYDAATALAEAGLAEAGVADVAQTGAALADAGQAELGHAPPEQADAAQTDEAQTDEAQARAAQADEAQADAAQADAAQADAAQADEAQADAAQADEAQADEARIADQLPDLDQP